MILNNLKALVIKAFYFIKNKFFYIKYNTYIYSMKNSVKQYRNIARNNQIASGHFMKPATQWFKDKTKYNRKAKHKEQY